MSFDWGSQRNHWLEQAWNGDIQCNAVSYATEFFIYNVNDYRRCVCRKFDSGNDNCMDGATADIPTDDDDDTGIWTGWDWNDGEV